MHVTPGQLAKAMLARKDILHAAAQQVERLSKRGDKVLDPMCGSGVLLGVAGRLGRLMYGFDVSPGMVVFSRGFLVNSGMRAEIGRANARSMPMADGFVDMILTSVPSMEVGYGGPGIELLTKNAYTLSLQWIVAEMKRVLREGGEAVFVQSQELTNLLTPICHEAGLPATFITVMGVK